MLRSTLASVVRSLVSNHRRPEPAGRRLRPAVEALETRAVPAAASALFNFEELSAATGLRTLTMRRGELLVTITRPGDTFDVADPGAGARAFFGHRSLSPSRPSPG